MKLVSKNMKRIAFVLLIAMFLSTNSLMGQNSDSIYKRLKNEYIHVVRQDGWYSIHNGKFAGAADLDGRIVVPTTRYTSIIYHNSNPKNKYYTVYIGKLLGILDSTGCEILPPGEYDKVYPSFEENIIKVYKNGKVGLYDTKQRRLFVKPDKYTGITKPSNYSYFYTQMGTLNGILDSTGHELVPPGDFTNVAPDYKAGIIRVSKNDKHGLLDINGKPLLGLVAKSYVYYLKENDCFRCRYTGSDGKSYTQLFNRKGKLLYDAPNPYIISEGVLAFQRDSLWGFIDIANGTTLLEPTYTSFEPFQNGVAKVTLGDEALLITNPLKGGSKVLSSMTVGRGSNSEIDRNIPETKRKSSTTFAFIVANENYSSFTVPFALNDGHTFKEYCLKTLGVPKSNITYHEDATLNQLRSMLQRAHDLADAFEGDAQIIFYFAGMGLTDKDGHAYLLPVDMTTTLLSSTALALASLCDTLGSLNAEYALALIDAGFNGENRDGSKVGSDITSKTKNVPTKGNLMLVTSASQGEAALQYKEKGHGLFTYYLCSKLQASKGDVTLHELAEYIAANTGKTASKTAKRQQSPQMTTQSESIKNHKL